MLGSGAVWGVVLGHTALNWGDYTLAQQLPTYLTNVLGYEGHQVQKSKSNKSGTVLGSIVILAKLASFKFR